MEEGNTVNIGTVRRTFAIAASAAVLFAACSSSPSAGGDKVKVAFVAGQIGITFYTGVECGAKAAAKEFDVDLNWTGSHNWDINETRPLIDAAKATNPQGWVISPTDPDALVNDIKGFMGSKQWVVTIDAPMSQPVELRTSSRTTTTAARRLPRQWPS
jgi:ABC-type sugar transport system substrate-binding protein